MQAEQENRPSAHRRGEGVFSIETMALKETSEHACRARERWERTPCQQRDRQRSHHAAHTRLASFRWRRDEVHCIVSLHACLARFGVAHRAQRCGPSNLKRTSAHSRSKRQGLGRQTRSKGAERWVRRVKTTSSGHEWLAGPLARFLWRPFAYVQRCGRRHLC